MKTLLTALAMSFAMAAPTVYAQDASVQLNDPKTEWLIFSSERHAIVVDEGVTGGKAVSAYSTGDGPSYAVGAILPFNAGIKKGDHITVTVWAKADADTSVNAMVQLRSAPYTSAGEGKLTLDKAWALKTLEFVAVQDFAPDTLQVALHLNTGAHTVFLGPVTVVKQAQ